MPRRTPNGRSGRRPTSETEFRTLRSGDFEAFGSAEEADAAYQRCRDKFIFDMNRLKANCPPSAVFRFERDRDVIALAYERKAAAGERRRRVMKWIEDHPS